MDEERFHRLTVGLKRWGFAALVMFAALGSVLVAVTVATPAEIPDFALQAAPIYRIETGAASFAGFYLLALALVLSLHSRGFTEIGMRGIRAEDLSGVADHRMFTEQKGVIQNMEKALQEMETGEAD